MPATVRHDPRLYRYFCWLRSCGSFASCTGADMDAADKRGVTPRDMLRISEDNCRKQSRERCSAAAALAPTEIKPTWRSCDEIRIVLQSALD